MMSGWNTLAYRFCFNYLFLPNEIMNTCSLQHIQETSVWCTHSFEFIETTKAIESLAPSVI